MKKMDKKTELYFQILNSLGLYGLLTSPHFFKITFNVGITYPLWLIIICSILSCIGGYLITKWEKENI